MDSVDLYILRHGKAETARTGTRDADRSLTEKGRVEIERISKWMNSQGIACELIATSPLKRGQETAGIVAEYTGAESRVVIWESLAPGESPDNELKNVVKERNDSAILIVGHEPMLSMFISRTIAGTDIASIVLAKGGLAKIRNFSFTQSLSGELQWLLTPKLMTGGP